MQIYKIFASIDADALVRKIGFVLHTKYMAEVTNHGSTSFVRDMDALVRKTGFVLHTKYTTEVTNHGSTSFMRDNM